MLIGVYAFAFNANTTYTCKTLGISFADKNGKMVNVPNTSKTADKMKNILKQLYTVKIKPVSKGMEIYVGDKKELLGYVKKVKKNINLYKTEAGDVYLLTDENASQIGVNIPSQKMIIYYQCK